MYNRRWFYNIVDKRVAVLNQSGEMTEPDTGKVITELGEGWLEFNDDPRHYGEQTLIAVGKQYMGG